MTNNAKSAESSTFLKKKGKKILHFYFSDSNLKKATAKPT
jgi:hypothetical protein